MSNVRRAVLSDVPFIVELGEEFYNNGPWRGVIDFSKSDLTAFITTMIEQTGVIFVDDNGMCGGFVVPAYFNASANIALELFWRSRGHGSAVKAAFEAYCKDAGAVVLDISTTMNRERGMRKLMGLNGFDIVGMTFRKEL